MTETETENTLAARVARAASLPTGAELFDDLPGPDRLDHKLEILARLGADPVAHLARDVGVPGEGLRKLGRGSGMTLQPFAESLLPLGIVPGGLGDAQADNRAGPEGLHGQVVELHPTELVDGAQACTEAMANAPIWTPAEVDAANREGKGLAELLGEQAERAKRAALDNAQRAADKKGRPVRCVVDVHVAGQQRTEVDLGLVYPTAKIERDAPTHGRWQGGAFIVGELKRQGEAQLAAQAEIRNFDARTGLTGSFSPDGDEQLDPNRPCASCGGVLFEHTKREGWLECDACGAEWHRRGPA